MAQDTRQDEFWCKIFQTKYDLVVAICDSKLLGRRIDFKGVKVKLSEEFYGGKSIDQQTALKLLQKASIANLFGKQIVKLALRHGFVERKNILLIQGQPHAQVVKL